jgi:hypothetical protein
VPAPERPVGVVTRGTTNPNRLRRMDRWLADVQGWRLRRPERAPVVVDLGYGASPVTALELHERLVRVRPDVEVVGIEIDPARVAAGRALERPGLRFALGGFEVPLPHATRPTVVRAFNVLRQYAEDEVPAAWALVAARLAPDGLLVDGTCDELGRLASWVAVEEAGPVSLTVSLRLRGLDHPSVVAERLPKVLIHHNVAGQPIHGLLTAADKAWASVAGHGVFGPRVRWRAMLDLMRDEGFPVEPPRRRMRDGVLSVPWSDVAPVAAPGSTVAPRLV